MKPNRRQIAALLVAILLLASGAAAAYSAMFQAGSGTTYEAPSGLVVSSSTDHGLDGTNPFVDSETIYLDGVSVSSAGSADVTVDQFRGNRTELSSIDATSSPITVDPDDKSAVEISGGVTALSWEDAALDNRNQITFSADGPGTITVTSLTAETNWTAATPDGELVDSGTTSVDGEADVDVESANDQELILFENDAPVADNASASPTASVNNENAELSIDVSDAQFGTAQGDSVSVEAFVDGSSIGTQTVSSNGTVTFDASNLEDGTHEWHVEMADSYGATSESQTFEFEVDHRAPDLDNASASPGDGSQLTNRTVNLSIDGGDYDFLEDSGDEVTLEWRVDGEVRDTTTVTSNGTWSTSVDVSEGGSHNWSVTATDEYGLSTTSQTFGFQVPSELRIYNESEPTALVDNATVTLRFFFESGDDLIVTRETSDGTVDFQGLPVDRPFVVVAEADGYRDRRIYVPSLFDTESVYLLPDEAEFTSPIFDIQDFTGSFPDSETVLRIERPLNGSWQTVQADFFGAAGEVPAQLEFNVRHRLTLVNTETGETRRLGTYTPLEAGVKQIRVTPDSAIVVSPDNVQVQIAPSITTLEATNDTSVNVSLTDPTGEIETWNVSVSWQNETSSEVLYEQTTAGPVQPTLNLSQFETGNVTVLVEWASPSGGQGIESKSYRLRIPMENQYSLLHIVSSTLPGMLPSSSWSAFSTMLALAVSIFVATAAASQIPMSTEMVGLVAVASLAGFSIIGFVGYEMVFVGGVGLVTMSMLRRGL